MKSAIKCFVPKQYCRLLIIFQECTYLLRHDGSIKTFYNFCDENSRESDPRLCIREVYRWCIVRKL